METYLLSNQKLQEDFSLISYLFVITILLSTASCGAPITVPPLTMEDVPKFDAVGNHPDRNYHLEPGDTLKITYTFHSEMDQDNVVIRPDGKITATQIGDLNVAGLTVEELENLFVQKTSENLRNPEVVISVTKFAEKTVYVAGEVNKAGPILYKKDLTPLQAVIAAGGFLEGARMDSVVLIRADNSSQEVLARRVDLAAVVTDGTKEPLYLAPHDIVYVPKTPIANAGLWIKQHLVDIVPFFRGTGLSYGIAR
jgi:protein involved in polysaccharide export with SLBB domain